MRPLELIGKQRPQTKPENSVVIDDEDSYPWGVSRNSRHVVTIAPWSDSSQRRGSSRCAVETAGGVDQTGGGARSLVNASGSRLRPIAREQCIEGATAGTSTRASSSEARALIVGTRHPSETSMMGTCVSAATALSGPSAATPCQRGCR